MTAIPDPSTLSGIGEALKYLMDEIHALRDELRELRGSTVLTPTQAERALGYGRSGLSPSRYPWRIPEYGARGTRHSLETWARWNQSPEGERRAKWDMIPVAERRRLLGAA